MTKIKQTITLSIKSNTPHIGATYGEVMVADVELVLIPLSVIKDKEWIEANRDKFVYFIEMIDHHNIFKPIMISRSEKIEKGDWVYNSKEKVIEQIKDKESLNFINEINSFEDIIFKILAQPEHFSPEQRQMIADGKLKKGKHLIVCEYAYNSLNQIIKLNTSNHITIHKHDVKTTFTTEEIVQFLSGRFTEKAPLHYVISEIEKGGIVDWYENWYENNGKIIYKES